MLQWTTGISLTSTELRLLHITLLLRVQNIKANTVLDTPKVNGVAQKLNSPKF